MIQQLYEIDPNNTRQKLLLIKVSVLPGNIRCLVDDSIRIEMFE